MNDIRNVTKSELNSIIEEHEKNIQELKKLNEFTQSILSAIPDDIIIVDKDKTIIWSNNKTFVGKKIEEFRNIYFDEYGKCPIEEVFECSKPVQFEIHEGDKVYWHIATPCNYNGSVKTVLEVRREITEKKRIDELNMIAELVQEVSKSNDRLNETLLKIKDCK